MAKFCVTLTFDLDIQDEDAFAAAVHPIAMQIGESEGGMSGMGTTNTHEAADMIAQDLRMGASTWSAYAMQVGVSSIAPVGTSISQMRSSNEPITE